MVSAIQPENDESKQSQIVEKASQIKIIHFNDVYNVEEQATEPKAGAARFKTAVKSFDKDEPLILFSGDILAPSIMSTFTQGEQMIEVMNQIGIHCAVYGNHDFDFGLDRLVEVANQTSFPWLMSNVIDNETDLPLADGKYTHIIDWKGWKIGLMGLVEQEWLDTLSTINCDELTYIDYVDKGIELAAQLKLEGCDYIIALTHMRTPNDLRLSQNVNEIDLILGGHDHDYECILVDGKYILKSGTDFREFSTISLSKDKSISAIDRIEVNSKFSPDLELQLCLKKYETIITQKMDEVLGSFSVDLDGRFNKIRTSESNLGNFICDVLLASCNSDVSILNSGTLRSDRIHPAGQFKMRDLMTILPMLDSVCVLEVTGKILHKVLENGVSQYPKLEGRFPQVSGVSFAFNVNAPTGSRVYKDTIRIGDQPLKDESSYRLATKAYMKQGRDGYDMLIDCPVLQDEEQCPMLSNAIQNHFKSVNSKLRNKNSSHRQSLVLLSRRHSLIRLDAENLLPVITPPFRHSYHEPLGRTASVDSQIPSIAYLSKRRLSRQESCEELENEACKLAPKLENRIIPVNEETIEEYRQTLCIHHTVEIIEELEEPSTPRSAKPKETDIF